MKASDFIAEFIESKGVTSVFELSGGMITHLLDSMESRTKINIVSMHHEQSAAFAADAYGRVSGVPGIALATSGPGATNLLTGIGSCYFDSSPAIFITGQVNRHELKGDRNIRQLGFQETDIISMAKPITKACFQIDNPEQIPLIFESAFNIALSGRPGPVLIDIPMDVQRAQISGDRVEVMEKIFPEFDDHLILELIEQIKSAKKPLILAGRGIKAASANSQLSDFVMQTQIPVVTSLLGFIGSYGNRWANIALGECDLLIVLGSRLDIRQTGADTNFISNRKIYQIDCEKDEINNRIKNCIGIVDDLSSFFKRFKECAADEVFIQPATWINYVSDLRKKWPDTSELSPKGINPNLFMHSLSRASSKSMGFVADVGSHQMWAAQSIELNGSQIFLTSGGMGAMGFALPAAIGACMIIVQLLSSLGMAVCKLIFKSYRQL
jgi:acetolactate synthase-1/2/3 large subunit